MVPKSFFSKSMLSNVFKSLLELIQTFCIPRFDQCFVKFKAEQAAMKAEQSKGKIPVGQKLKSKEINQLLKKNWPQSMRTSQDYIQPDFDPMKQKTNKRCWSHIFQSSRNTFWKPLMMGIINFAVLNGDMLESNSSVLETRGYHEKPIIKIF